MGLLLCELDFIIIERFELSISFVFFFLIKLQLMMYIVKIFVVPKFGSKYFHEYLSFHIFFISYMMVIFSFDKL